MAEAAVEEPVIARLFFCHKCSSEIPRVLPDYTCPTCYSGFIEELETPPENVSGESSMDVEDGPGMDLLNQRLREELSEIILGVGGFGAERLRSHRGRDRDASETRRSGRYGGILPRERNIRNRSASTGTGRQVAPIETLIQDFIVNLTGGGGGGGAVWQNGRGLGRAGNAPVFFLGNPGDYAWGREGLDAIVTQLLNQMDGAGPPPLAKDKIKEIPIVVITEEQVSKSLQCSVCWEDFRLEEPVRKLPCEHVYHESCIIPWLELHGTCPVCRQSLSEDGQDENQANLGANSMNVGPSLAALFRAANPPATGIRNSSSSSSTSSSSSSGSNTSGNNSSSSSSRSSRPSPDFNMDLEFD